ncbi:MAG TPA: extracellular solute-binding protein [Solirubrobacteraceae bacterium]|nr:extracellular solute-binding protein [Solirubrobacteraceae bacterium]
MQLFTRARGPVRRGPLRRSLCAVLLAAGACLALAGCGGSSGSSGKGTLVIYSAQHPETTAAIVAAFTKQTGIKVELKNDDEDVLTAQLEQEGSRSPADIFYTENSNWLQQLDDKGMLASVPSSTLARVPSRDNAANGKWLGVSGRYSVLIYNPGKISASQLPTTAEALADPKYKGKLELAPAETDFWPIITSMIRAHGRQAALTWLEGLKANAGSDDHTPDNETLVGDVSKGDADMGLINHYYYYRIRAEMGAANFHAKLAWLAPRDPGFVEDISGAAELKSAPHPAAAQKFLAFLVSQAGQNVIAHSKSFEYPLVSGVAPNAELPATSTLKPNPITPAQIGTGIDARNLLRQAGLI